MCGQWVSFRWVPYLLPPPPLYQGLLEDGAESLPSDWELSREELCFLLLALLAEAVVAPGRPLLSAFIGSPPLPPLRLLPAPWGDLVILS